MKIRFSALAFAVVMLCSSCQFEKIGSDLGSGLNKNTKAMGKNLAAGLSEGLIDSAFQQKVNRFIDSLVITAGLGLNQQTRNLRDSLLNDQLRNYVRALVNDATGQNLQANIAALRNELLGTATNERVKLLVETAVHAALNDETNARLGRLRDELLGDATNLQLSRLRDSLLGPKLALAVQTVLDSAFSRTNVFLQKDLGKSIEANASIIQKYATQWLLLLAAIAIAIIIIVWRNKQKYARMVTVLTSQIHSIPDQQAYDELTSRIKDKAVETGVEPDLRKVLVENGMLGSETYERRKLKKAKILQNKN